MKLYEQKTPFLQTFLQFTKEPNIRIKTNASEIPDTRDPFILVKQSMADEAI